MGEGRAQQVAADSLELFAVAAVGGGRGKAHPGLARVELARVAGDLGDEGHPVVLVVAGPGDEALLERVAEAGDAVTGVARVQVLTARAEVIVEFSPAAPVGDAHGVGRRVADRGAVLDG